MGKKEHDGPLGGCFDRFYEDQYCGQKTWEQGERELFRQAVSLCCRKGDTAPEEIGCLLAGDLLNQCVSSSYTARELPARYLGVYGACSTMAEALSLAAAAVDGGYADRVLALTGSHFCTAERQFRLPLEYGGQRTPTAQWTVTGAGAVLLSADGEGPFITHITTGRVLDAGVTDVNNMGAAMAPAAYDTIKRHFDDTGRTPADYDLILTGDLGRVGHAILLDLLSRDGITLGTRSTDCGILIYDPERQDVRAGGSGCGCSASVLCGHILPQMRAGKLRRVLFAATGALMSPTASLQGESIPGICHAVVFDREQEG